VSGVIAVQHHDVLFSVLQLLLIDQILQRHGIQVIDHFSFSVAHSSWVMQRAPLAMSAPWQFSLPPHWVASSGSSTAMMMSATVTLSARRARL
jgi:hypothetical protein